MECNDVGDQAVRVVLHGRLDTKAIDQIETRFTALVAGSKKHALVDLRDVAFAASMALRMLIANARVLHQRGKRMVLFGAQPLVREVFDHVAMDDLIPTAIDEADAIAKAMGTA